MINSSNLKLHWQLRYFRTCFLYWSPWLKHFPHADGFISRKCDHMLSIRREFRSNDRRLVTILEVFDLCEPVLLWFSDPVHLPKLKFIIRLCWMSRYNISPISAKYDLGYIARAPQLVHILTFVPQMDELITTGDNIVTLAVKAGHRVIKLNRTRIRLC